MRVFQESKKVIAITAMYALFAALLNSILHLPSIKEFFNSLPSSKFVDTEEKFQFVNIYVFLICLINVILYLILSFKSLILSSINRYWYLLLISVWTVIAFIPSILPNLELRGLLQQYFYNFGVGHLYPNFVDLRGTLAAMNRVNNVGDSFNIECSPIDSPCLGWKWTYGSLILKIPTFGFFTEKYAFFIAILIFSLVIFILCKQVKNRIEIITLCLFAPTGTSLLIIERMNIDILMIPLLYLLSRIVELGKIQKSLVFMSLILFTLTKYYTWPLLIILIPFLRSKTEKYIFGISALVILPLMFSDIAKAGSDAFGFGYAATHGLGVLIGISQGKVTPTTDFLSPIALILFVIVLMLTLFLARRYLELGVGNNASRNDSFLFASAVLLLLTTWLISVSYPYRLATLLLTVPILCRMLKSHRLLLSSHLSLLFGVFLGIHISLTLVRNSILLVLLPSLLALSLNCMMRNSHFVHNRMSEKS